MTAVISRASARPERRALGYRSGVEATTAEERRLRAARRFGRLGFVLTGFWLLLLPATVLWLSGFALGGVLLPLFAVALVLHVMRIRQVTRSLGTPAPVWHQVATAVIGLAIVAAGQISGPFGYMWGLVAGILVGDIVGGMSARRVAIWVVSAIVAVFGVSLAALALVFPYMLGDESAPEWYRWFAAGTATFYVASLWFVDVERMWWLKAVTELDDSRRQAADLATARERLRLADDLHDILGHALEVVAFKSELATRLQAVDPARATAEMEEVQRVARESMREVRALVHDARSTDLVTELAGARAVLDSAGIALVVTGDPAQVGPTARTVFGRVLREAMTNVLRHAQPSHCAIEIVCADGSARLRIVNDGVLPPTDDSGTGIIALRRYLTENAGKLDAGQTPDGSFALSAEMPA